MRIPVWAVVILALLLLIDVGFRATQFVTERRVTPHFDLRDFTVRRIEEQSRLPYWEGRGNLVVKEAEFREKNLAVFVWDNIAAEENLPYGRFVQTIAVEKGIGTLTTFDYNGPRKHSWTVIGYSELRAGTLEVTP